MRPQKLLINHLNPSSHLRLAFLLIPPALLCFALLPSAQAVSPPPDGGYSGWNTAEGTNALFSRTTGIYNTALGGQALFTIPPAPATQRLVLTPSTTTLAAWTTRPLVLKRFFHNSGNYNTATGFAALLSNTTGGRNTANGVNALRLNMTGTTNTAIGTNPLYFNTNSNNTAIGDSALFNNTEGDSNTARGCSGAPAQHNRVF